MRTKALFLAIVMLLSLFICGCDKAEKLPTFEELSIVNSFDELFEAHTNVYVKTTCVPSGEGTSIVQDTVYVKGEGKVDYFMREKLESDDGYSGYAARSGQEWYYLASPDPITAVLEVGESFFFDYSVPDFFDATPIGNTYMYNGQIVHHAYDVEPATEDYNAVRYDYTYYFNASTKCLDKIVQLYYNYQHELIATYTSEFYYSVNVKDLFGDTLKDVVYNSDNRIDVEIIVGYNTESQKSYSLVATTDSVLYAVIDNVTYVMYTDHSCQNMVMTLEGFSGKESVTLYAYPLYAIE